MYIIIGKENADMVRDRYPVMELETLAQGTAYCVLPIESIVQDMPDMERLSGLHHAVVEAWNRGDYSTVLFGIEHVYGRFGGELDSFYDVLKDRIKEMTVEQD